MGGPNEPSGRPASRRRRRARGRGRRRRGRRSPDGPGSKVSPAEPEERQPGQYLGVLEVLGRGSGFIRRPDDGYVPGNDDVYVGSRLIHRFGLRTGDELSGTAGRRPRNGKNPPLQFLDEVNGGPPRRLPSASTSTA